MNWKDKAVAATNGTKFGAIVCCALDRSGDAEPRFNGKASVTSDRFVMCNFTNKEGEGHMGAFVGSLDDVVTNIEGLADHLSMTKEERAEFAAVMCDWIAMDYSNSAKGRIAAVVKQ